MTSVMTERVARKLNSLVWHLICVLVLIGASVLSGSVSRAQSPEPPSTGTKVTVRDTPAAAAGGDAGAAGGSGDGTSA